MDKIVVDSSVVIKWFVNEPLSMDARLILTGYQTNSLALYAPDLINAEVGNIVWKKCRFQGLAAIDAQQIITEFRKLMIISTPTADLLDEAYRLAVAHDRTVYDALYVALSIREQCPYITADEKLVNALSVSYPNVLWVANRLKPSAYPQ